MNIAGAVRNWAEAEGLPTPARGRVSRELIASYLRANPAVLRRAAEVAGIEVGQRGRIKSEVADQVAATL
jgi:hypothetical protein